MIYKFKNSTVVLDNDGVIGKKLSTINNSEHVYLSLQKGKEVAPHALPIEVTFFVINGTGTASIDGTEYVASKGDMIRVEPNCLRGWINSGDELLELFVIKRLS